MNRKQLITLLVLVAVIGGAGLLVQQHNKSSWQSAGKGIGQKLLGENFPINDVALIAIKQGTNELNLAKKNDRWGVRERNDYPANFSEISELMLKMRDLKIARTEEVGASDLPRLALAPGQGTNPPVAVDFKDQGGKTIRSLLLGKKTMQKSNRPSPFGDMGGDEGYPNGRYVKVGNSSDVALISDALDRVDPKPEQWLNKDFLRIEKVRSVAVTFPNATNSWKLARETETGEWKLADTKPGEQLDTAKASGATSSLGGLNFNDVAINAKPEALGLDKPNVVTVETFDHFTYTLKVGQKTNDSYPLSVTLATQLPKERTAGKDEKPEDKTKLDKEFKDNQKKLEDKLAQEKACEPWVYLVSSYSIDSVLKERSQLMAEKKEEPKDGKTPAPGSTPVLDVKPAAPVPEVKPAAIPVPEPPVKPASAPTPPEVKPAAPTPEPPKTPDANPKPADPGAK